MMLARHRRLKAIVLLVLFVPLLLLSVWVVDRQLISALETYFDFYQMWRGSREVFAGRDPYTNNVALDIQQHTLGHPARPGEIQLIVPVPASYDLVLCLFPVFLGLRQLQSHRQAVARVLYGVLWLTPIISWSTNTLWPLAFDAMGWTYNVWTADKILIPTLTFVMLIYLVRHSDGRSRVCDLEGR